MAESFHTIIDRGSFTVTHRGEEARLDLPPQLAGMAGMTENEQELVAYCEEEEILLAVLQRGVQAAIIDARAVARPKVNAKTDESDSLVATKEQAQSRLDAWKMKPIARPGQSKDPMTAARKAMAALEQQGLSKEDIMAALGLGE